MLVINIQLDVFRFHVKVSQLKGPYSHQTLVLLDYRLLLGKFLQRLLC